VPAESIKIWTRKHAITMPVWRSTATLTPRADCPRQCHHAYGRFCVTQGFYVASDDNLRPITDRLALSPIDLMRIILTDESGARQPR